MEEGIPAWLVCVDILNKAKNELITEAMDTLKEQIGANNIAIEGNLVTTMPDKSAETERDIFIINRLLENANNIRQTYNRFISEKESVPQNLDSETVERIAKLKVFLLSLDKIEFLMEYSGHFSDWDHDVSMEVKIGSPAEIIAKTVRTNPERREILMFLLNSKIVQKEEIFSENERDILSNALKMAS